MKRIINGKIENLTYVLTLDESSEVFGDIELYTNSNKKYFLVYGSDDHWSYDRLSEPVARQYAKEAKLSKEKMRAAGF